MGTREGGVQQLGSGEVQKPDQTDQANGGLVKTQLTREQWCEFRMSMDKMLLAQRDASIQAYRARIIEKDGQIIALQKELANRRHMELVNEANELKAEYESVKKKIEEELGGVKLENVAIDPLTYQVNSLPSK